MKFITEYDLRAQFNEQPFADYQMEENTRLTPGARQFLSDRGINLFEDGTKMRFGAPAGNPKEQEGKQNLTLAADAAPEMANAKLLSYMEILEAEFLVLISQMIERDIEMAGQMSKLGPEFGRIKMFFTDESADVAVYFEECTGMNGKNCSKDLGNCFEISDFHIQSVNGKMLVQMNALRAKIRAIRIPVAEAFSEPKDKNRLITVTEAVNRIVNRLSQMICMAAGVKECRRTQ